MTSTSLAAPSPSEHSADLGRASTSNAPSPTAVSNRPTPAPDSTQAPSTQPANTSRSMTAEASTPSDYPNSNGADASASASYGTRSRGRPGRARPNYADSNELDLEIEAAGKVSKPLKKAAAPAGVPIPAQVTDLLITHNGFAAVNGTPPAMADTTAPATNGTSNAAAATAAPSKKRKQPGSSTTVSPPQSHLPKPRSGTHPRPQFHESSMLTFSKSRARLNEAGQLIADDDTVIQPNDHAYFVCEPPGEPYYFGRIMEFLHEGNLPSRPVEAVRVNWFYRPKDIQRRVQDTRIVFASMHSDTCPLTALRGKCHIEHSADIPDIDEFRKQPDSFWFNQLYDRYMHRYYEVIPTSKVVNVPRHVKKVLDERWKFVLVEVGRTKDLTSASKICKRCGDFAANHNSVDCSTCKNTYHMSCVRPPLPKKPARGFGWVCAPCSRAADLKLEARNTPLSETELSRHNDPDGLDEDDSPPQDLTTRENSAGAEEHPPPTAAQLAQASLWPWRYFGIHSKPEDALDYDDRIYPRASSRLGPRHQANTTVWHGRPIEYVKPAEGKKKYKPASSAKKDAKTVALLENDKRPKRPKWVFDEPPGFVPRGSDELIELKGKKEYTAQLTFKMPEPGELSERGADEHGRCPDDFGEIVDAYMRRCDKEIAPLYGLKAGSVDVRTKGLEKLQENGYDVDKALEAMRHLSAKIDLKQPELTKDEIRRFEEGVAKYGSELHAVARHVSPNIKESRIVRFYYTWKKTSRGRDIWGNFENRKSKKDSKRVEKDNSGTRLLEDVGDEADDSAYDNEKAARIKRGFCCKFCKTTSSRVWRRAPQTAPGTLVPRGDPTSKQNKDKSSWLVLALCGKCAYLWRRYAVQYESIEEIGRKIAIAGGRASKRKVDEELMRIVLEAQNFTGDTITTNTAQIAKTAGIDVPMTMIEADEPPKKKTKGGEVATTTTTEVVIEKKRMVPERPIELEPLKPEMPRVKEHPCAVCHIMNHPEHKILKCRDCRLHVHAPCYGVNAPVGNGPWFCDTCRNDHTTLVSTNYECVLCPVRRTPQELMEPPKVSHKKKTEREREKERAEREMVQEAGKRWREEQLAAGRPVDPREPLKRTAWNNWMHVNCAVWIKEIKFGDAEHLDNAEGMGFITEERLHGACKFCPKTGYPTIACHFPSCNETFHVGCAHQEGCILGFDISHVKGSRREIVPVMKLDQESGLAVPGIWCPHHPITTIVHNLLETTPSGLTALQEYVRTYKQVDNSVTGTVRRAAQYQSNVASGSATAQPSHRRTSTINGHPPQQTHTDTTAGGNTRSSPSPASPHEGAGNGRTASSDRLGQRDVVKSEKKCCSCLATTTPKWWTVKPDGEVKNSSPALQSQLGRQSPSSAPAGTGQGPPPMSPTLHARNPALFHTLIKAEPTEIDTLKVPEEVRYQCHKCHVMKKVPPASPSHIRRKEQNHAEPVPEQAPLSSAYPPSAPPGPVPVTYAPPEGPVHPHPPIHGAVPTPQHWPNGRPPWPAGPPGPPGPPGPQLTNGTHPGPPPPVAYGAPPPVYHSRPSGEFAFPYPAPSIHYPVPGALPPPGSRPHPNGITQHSPPPPPAPFSYPPNGQPPPPVQPGSPHVGPVNSGVPGSYMHPPADPNSITYGPPRGYAAPPAGGPPRVPSAVGVGQIPPPAEAASRRQSGSGESVSTPLMGMRLPAYQGMGTQDTPIDLDGPGAQSGPNDAAARRGSTAGPSVSVSPSLRNLLS